MNDEQFNKYLEIEEEKLSQLKKLNEILTCAFYIFTFVPISVGLVTIVHHFFK